MGKELDDNTNLFIISFVAVKAPKVTASRIVSIKGPMFALKVLEND